MRATYGAAFDRQWECPVGVTPEAHVQSLMEVWGRGLAQFQQNPNAIAFGLDNLPEDFPPNLPQFRALCNRRPDMPHIALNRPKADPERVAREITKIRANFRPGDCLDPLRALHDRDVNHGGIMANGKPITLAQRQTYRQALKLDRPESEQ
jgi:hypothetical protein